MRVAIINHGLFPFLLGGMERHTTFLAEHLCRLGVSVDVYVPTLPTGAALRLKEDGFRFNIVEHEWPASLVWLRANYLYSERVGDALRSDGGYDLVYCQGFNGWNYLTETAPSKRAKCIYNPHGLEMFKTVGALQTLKHLPMRWAAQVQAKHADVVVSLGGRLTEEIGKFLQVDDSRLLTLPNAIDLDYVRRLTEQVPKNRDLRSLLFVGRLEFNKGVDLLCAAVNDMPNIKLRIVGDGPLRHELQCKYAGQKIEFLGKLDDQQLFTLYCQSGALAFASLYEGMPTVILEAMACGLPVIATDIGAVRTMIDERCGIVVQPGSVQALKQAIEKYTSLTESSRFAMQQAAQEKVAAHFTWPHVAKMTLALLPA